MKKILAFMKRERTQVIAVVLCIVLTMWGLSCESKVQSLMNPLIKVTRDELRIEVERFLATAEIRFKSLDRQDELKALFFDKLVLWSQTGVFNPMGILPLIVSILGIAAMGDNVKKRIDIKKLNNVSKGSNT